MTTDEQFAKLPKHAQKTINDLKRELEHKTRQINDLVAELTGDGESRITYEEHSSQGFERRPLCRSDRGGSLNFNLTPPSMPIIKRGHDVRVILREDGDHLVMDLNADGNLVVIPNSRNSVYVRLERRF